MSIEKGTKFELTNDLAIDHILLRWGQIVGERHFLDKRRYIVVYASTEEIWVSPADWDENGEITFHSTKHRMIVKGKQSMQALKNAM